MTDDIINQIPDSNTEIERRIETLNEWREKGIDPFGTRFERTKFAKDILSKFPSNEEDEVIVAGRVTAKRDMGKAVFMDLTDSTDKVQLFCKVDNLGADVIDDLTNRIHVGDFVGARGEIFKTKRGEISIRVREIKLLAKAVRPLPEKWHGLRDVELRYRQRYLDLVANPEVRRVFEARGRVIREIRNYLDEIGFLEVETPVFHKIPGGATARPFSTHHNAQDMDLFLRISLELHLKMAMIGGIERVYEMNKVFRNEGMDRDHSPEYTMLELYQAYGDYTDMMKIVEDIFLRSALTIHGSHIVTYRGEQFDLTPPWPRKKFADLMLEHSGIDIRKNPSIDELQTKAKTLDPESDQIKTRGKLIDLIFSKSCEDHLRGPMFVIDYPIEISPLAKRISDQDGFVYRFETYILGSEMANAFTELNDPLDQRGRFLAQMKERAEGDDEAMQIDEEFLLAMEHGMPPAGGLGVGIDRMVMFLMDQPSIRDVILFPLMK